MNGKALAGNGKKTLSILSSGYASELSPEPFTFLWDKALQLRNVKLPISHTPNEEGVLLLLVYRKVQRAFREYLP